MAWTWTTIDNVALNLMVVLMITNHHHHHRGQVAVHLVKGGGEQHAADYKKLNPMEQATASSVIINNEQR